MAFIHRYRWPLGIGLATLAAVMVGTMIGDDAASDIEPFYTNVVLPQSTSALDRPAPEAPAEDAGNGALDAVDLAYDRARASAITDTAQPAR